MKEIFFKNNNYKITVSEDTTPEICGCEKGIDYSFSISIKVESKCKNRNKKICWSYSNTWLKDVAKEEVLFFITSILSNPIFRSNYGKSEFVWDDEYNLTDDEANAVEGYLEEVLQTKKEDVLKKIKLKTSINTSESLKHLSLKLDLISLYMSDDDLKYICDKLKRRNSILYAMSLITNGESLDRAVEMAENMMQKEVQLTI